MSKSTPASEIYLDNAATTKILPDIISAMTPVLSENYGNASSIYALGRKSRYLLDTARDQTAALLHASPDEIYFTGGGSEGDNMLLQGLARQQGPEAGQIITSQVEHPAVLRTCRRLEQAGFAVAYLPADEQGIVPPEVLRQALQRQKTFLVSIMYANNEVGTIEPIKELAALAHAAGAYFHTDAVQAAGHIPLDVGKEGIDLLTLTAHKFHGPKGAGAVYIKRGLKIAPLILGGGQEREERAGTENTPGIVGLGLAAAHALKGMTRRRMQVEKLRDLLINGLLKSLPDIRLNGSLKFRLPGNVNFSFPGCSGEELVLLLDQAGIAVSSGSACSSGSLEPSRVLLALGLAPEMARSSLRLTLSEFTTQAEIEKVLQVLPPLVLKLQQKNF